MLQPDNTPFRRNDLTQRRFALVLQRELLLDGTDYRRLPLRDEVAITRMRFRPGADAGDGDSAKAESNVSLTLLSEWSSSADQITKGTPDTNAIRLTSGGGHDL
jgi:hypothetical protein